MAITVTHQNENDETTPAMFGEQEHLKYAAKVTFPELVFESLSGQKPDQKQLKLFNLILNLCFDHGPNSPSGAATIEATKNGQPMGQAVAAGIAQINERHGGAIEPGMRFFNSVRVSKDQSIKEMVEDYFDNGKLIGGFGHRVYKEKDPRAELILQELEEIDGSEGLEFVRIAREIEKAIEVKKGKKLVLNVDGAIAVVLCSWGWEPEWSQGVFIIARSAGLVAHYLNNSDR